MIVHVRSQDPSYENQCYIQQNKDIHQQLAAYHDTSYFDDILKYIKKCGSQKIMSTSDRLPLWLQPGQS